MEVYLQMKSPDPAIRARAALAAGRIGNAAAIPTLSALIAGDNVDDVRQTAMFAVGEIESVAGSEAVLAILENTRETGDLRARAVEAAGKIAAANAKDPKAKELGKAIVEALNFESGRRSMSDRDVIIAGLTAALRVRPEGAAEAAAKFLRYSDARVRADVGNTLTRLQANVATDRLRVVLSTDPYPVARANAARALGAAKNTGAIPQILNAALSDSDSRVRVSAVRALAGFRDSSVAPRLIERGDVLLKEHGVSKLANPVEKNELLEIATTLGRLLAGTKDAEALRFLDAFRTADRYVSPETEIAVARIAPESYVATLGDEPENAFGPDWRTSSAAFQALGEIANLEANEANNPIRTKTKLLLVTLISGWIGANEKAKASDGSAMAIPDLFRAFAAFKSETTSDVLRPLLASEPDPIVRATIADILGEQKAGKENIEALKKAFAAALVRDRVYNDATLSMLDALFKLDKAEATESLLAALKSSDYLVRKKALELLRDPELQKAKPGIQEVVGNALAKNKNRVSALSAGSRLGIVNGTQADYVRAVSRRNGTVEAVLTTEKGTFRIELMPEQAPLTVDNFIKLARARFFNGLAVHRVVPNFVMQDGDNRGDGNGGPGRSIRCEVNMLPYERGAVGMALSGKDTGGSQWFVTHSPQPHLDGGYTVFGRVQESEMKVVDSIVRGDRIIKVEIRETRGRQKQ
jgi:cyclophilin family peptidyl-prolyl cis-trans isomerase/HEAT repeat protein